MSVDPPSLTVTIDGTPLALASVSEAIDVLAPEVDSCRIEVPWGRRRIAGAADPAEVVPALGSVVAVTTGGYTWRGLLTRRARIGQGRRRALALTAHGPGLALDRSYLPSFARVGLSGVVQTPGGPRFAPGTMSATDTTVGGTAVRYLTAGGGTWTVEKALASFIAHATAFAGLPAITLDAAGADLSRRLPDTDCDGVSVHAGIQAILGHRMGLWWRLRLTAGGWVLRVRGQTGSGAAVNLTAGDVLDYDVGEDASAALAELEMRGARRIYAVSVDGKASGDLVSDWTSGDVADRAGGDLSSPAYRRFTLSTFALPDGSPSTTADPVPSLPISASTSLLSGSSPWLLFAQLAADSSWVSLQGRCSIAVGGGRVWIEGIDPASWATWSRIRLTLALSPRSHLSAVRSGGSGLGRGLAVAPTRHVYAQAAATRVSGSGLATVTGSAIAEQDPIDDEADALWAHLSGPQTVATWSRLTETGPEPGDRVTSFVLPVPGEDPETIAVDCVCTSKRLSRQRGRNVWTWEVAPRPFATGALVR